MILLVALLSLLAVKAEFNYRSVEHELFPYVNDYYKLAEKYCPNKNYNTTDFYDIKFVPEMSNYEIGACTTLLNGGYKIEINKRWWDENNSFDRRELVYHEMAHCLIYKEHVNNIYNYMNPMFYSLKYQDYTDQASLDIFNRCHK